MPIVIRIYSRPVILLCAVVRDAAHGWGSQSSPFPGSRGRPPLAFYVQKADISYAHEVR